MIGANLFDKLDKNDLEKIDVFKNNFYNLFPYNYPYIDFNNLKDIKVIMENSNPKDYKKYPLPKGFSIVMYKNGYEYDWARIQTELKQFNTIEDALICFSNTFLNGSEDVYKKCFFIQDGNGKNVATASIWDGNHFGKTMQRIHWVAVSKKYQNIGLGKSLVSTALDLFNSLYSSNYIYLTSQISSYKALNIYSQFGFKPYLSNMPKNFGMDSDTFQRNSEYAWKLISAFSNKNYLSL